MVYERLEEIRKYKANESHERQFAIDAAKYLLQKASVVDSADEEIPQDVGLTLEPEIDEKVVRATYLRSKYLQLLPDWENESVKRILSVYNADIEVDVSLGEYMKGRKRVIFSENYQPGTRVYENDRFIRNFLRETQNTALSKVKEEFTELEMSSIDGLKNVLPIRIFKLLRSMNIVRDDDEFTKQFIKLHGLPLVEDLGTLTMRSEKEVLVKRGMGNRYIDIIKNELEKLDLGFADDSLEG